MYTALLHLDTDQLSAGISEVCSWLNERDFNPTTFDYSIGPHIVRVQIFFDTLKEAAAVAHAFGGLVLDANELARSSD